VRSSGCRSGALRWVHRTLRARRHSVASAILVALATLWSSSTAFAQLDPLLFLKRVPPTVIIVFDTSVRMLEDGFGNFYDPNFYVVPDDTRVATALGIGGATKTYGRVYRNLQYAAAPGKYTADSIAAQAAAWDPANPLTSNGGSDIAFLDPTRYAIAK